MYIPAIAREIPLFPPSLFLDLRNGRDWVLFVFFFQTSYGECKVVAVVSFFESLLSSVLLRSRLFSFISGFLDNDFSSYFNGLCFFLLTPPSTALSSPRFIRGGVVLLFCFCSSFFSL